MKTMFKVNCWDSTPEIQPVEVEKTTAKSVWVNGRRNGRDTSHEKFFETHQEAKDWLQERCEMRIRNLQEKFEQEKVNRLLIQNFKEQ